MNLTILLRNLNSFERPKLIVMNEADAKRVKDELDQLAYITSDKAVGPITQWQINGVPVAITDVAYSFIVNEFGGHPTIHVIAP